MAGFLNLRVWQESITLGQEIYELTNNSEFAKDYGLKDQIRRATVSISSNIAEGQERGSHKDSIRFFYIAKGSVAEVISQLYFAMKIHYIDKDSLERMVDKCEKIKASLIKLIQARRTFLK